MWDGTFDRGWLWRDDTWKRTVIMRNDMIWKLVVYVSAINGLVCFALSSTYNMSFGKLGFVGLLLYLLISSIIWCLIVRGKRIRVSEKVQGFVAALIFIAICFLSVVHDKLVTGKSDALSIISYGSFALMSLSMSRKLELGFETGFSTFFLQLFAAQLFKINSILSPIALVFCSLIIILRHSSESNGVLFGSAITPNGYHPSDAVIDIREESQDSLRMGEVSGQSLLSRNNQQKNQEESTQAIHHSASNGQVSEGRILEDSDDQQNKEGEEDRSSLPAESRDLPKTELRRRRPISTGIQNTSSSVADPHETAMPEEASKKARSFMEESTKFSDLSEHERAALRDLKLLVQQALDNHLFSAEKTKNKKAESSSQVASNAPRDEPTEPTKAEEETTAKTGPAHVVAQVDSKTETMEAINESSVTVSTSVPKVEEKVSIWGIPLLADERSDVILLKFLRARDLEVKKALRMIKNTIRWRKEFGVEELVNGKNLGDNDLEKVVYMHGFDNAGHPVCYNIYGEFQNKELYKKTFSDEKRDKFLRWRIQFLEKTIRKLDFTPGGISTIVQVNDLKDSPGRPRRELRQAIQQVLRLFQDNYPEFVAKQVFTNVPGWYLPFIRRISPFLTQRTKSKFVFDGPFAYGPSKSAETLLRYIAAEHIPVKHGGLSRDGEIGKTQAVTEITVRPESKHTVEFPVTEKCHVCWEVSVIGWNVSYGTEFVPSRDDSYTVIIQSTRMVASSDEAVICDSFKTGEPGKLVLTIDNQSSREKKLLYRFKSEQPPSD